MSRRRRQLTALVALALLVTACSGSDATSTTAPPPTSAPPLGTTAGATAPAETTTTTLAGFIGADGVESQVTDLSRIVSLGGAISEVLWELGLGPNIVGIDVTTTYPPEATGAEIVGIGRFLTAEGVLRVEPTVVLGDTQTAPPEAIEQIRSAGVPVVIFEVPETFEALYDKIRSIGELVGEPEAAAALADSVKADVDEAAALVAGVEDTPNVVFLYSRGPGVNLLFGRNMITGPIIEAAGGFDGGAAIGIEGTVDLTPEALVAAAPDVLVTTAEGLEANGGLEGFLEVPGIAQTPAGQAGRILAYPEGDFLILGPRIGKALLAFVRDLHPELGG